MLFHVDEQLGAVQIGGGRDAGRVQFRLFFPAGVDPQIQEIRVAGSFQRQAGGVDWDFDGGPSLVRTQAAEGDFWTLALPAVLTAGFYQYKFQVRFNDGSSRKVTDPCARYSGTDNQNSGFVIGGSRPADNPIVPLAERKPLRDLVVYEMHPDDFTAEFRGARAPFAAVEDKLDYLAGLGINAILFMPWTAWKNKDYDWGYEPFQYFAVEYRYANGPVGQEKLSTLKHLISACHQRGIAVMMDGVFNHCSPDFAYKQFYLDTDACPYTAAAFGGKFPGLQDLDFANSCTQDFIRDVCLYWIQVFGIDGIRFDNSVNYYVVGKLAGLRGLLSSIQDYADGIGRPNFPMTLEHLDESAANVVNQTKATSFWDDGLLWASFDQLGSGAIAPRFLSVLNDRQYVDGPDKVPTFYLSNHDHSTLAWKAGEATGEGRNRWYRTQPHAIALLTLPGTPMIQAGQEFATEYRVADKDEPGNKRIQPRPLRWANQADARGSALWGLYRRLMEIRREHPSLRSRNFHPPKWEGWQTQFDADGFGVDTQKQVVVYHRWGDRPGGGTEYFIIALNFSEQDQPVTLPFPVDGTWADMLAGGNVEVANFSLGLTLEANWGHVFLKA